MKILLNVNGQELEADITGPESLLYVLRERLGLPGAKGACEQGECGSCSVVLDEVVVCACLIMAADAVGSSITTVEGIGGSAETGPDRLHPVQEALIAAGAVQCGFCTPGFVVTAAHLIDSATGPLDRDEIREALSGNLCRCTGYGAILRAIEELAT